VGEVRQLTDQLSAEDGLELATGGQPRGGWGVQRHGRADHPNRRRPARNAADGGANRIALTITLDVFIPWNDSRRCQAFRFPLLLR
jgi:hypothetical protein